MHVCVYPRSDSLGNEVNDNLMNLLLQSDHWAPGSGVRCSNSGKRKLHRLKVEEVGSNTSLVSCIEATAIALQQSLAGIAFSAFIFVSLTVLLNNALNYGFF